jgi:hypothetical protein
MYLASGWLEVDLQVNLSTYVLGGETHYFTHTSRPNNWWGRKWRAGSWWLTSPSCQGNDRGRRWNWRWVSYKRPNSRDHEGQAREGGFARRTAGPPPRRSNPLESRPMTLIGSVGGFRMPRPPARASPTRRDVGEGQVGSRGWRETRRYTAVGPASRKE